MMEILFLGTGTPYPDPERGSSAILVDVASSRLLLDCGRNCVQRMAGIGIAPASVTHCFLTHSHYDHIADLALLVLTSWRFGRKHVLKVFGPPGTRAIADAWFEGVYRIDIAARKSLRKGERGEVLPDIAIAVREMQHGDIVEEDGWRVRAVEVEHWPIPVSLGFLVEDARRRIFFTGDTSPCNAVREAAAGTDLLIHEAMYFPPDSGHYRSHSHPERVGEVARDCGARRLVLTHLQPRIESGRLLNDVSRHFPGPVTIAADEMKIAL
jgi:ribonuclease Z